MIFPPELYSRTVGSIGSAIGIAMTFRSAVDRWLYVVYAVILGVTALSLIQASSVSGDSLNSFFALISLLLVVGLPVWLFRTTRYCIESDALKIQPGPKKWTIPLTDIHAVKASRSLLSSPAFSLDRLEICYQEGKSVLVSPEDRKKFLRRLGVPLSK